MWLGRAVHSARKSPCLSDDLGSLPCGKAAITARFRYSDGVMKADTLTLKQVFSKDIRYVVPMFQRPYVWSKDKHWEPLWQDVRTTTERLIRVKEAGGATSPAHAEELTAPHFLGAIVIDQIPSQVVEVEARHVIDGQQRLTTLQILLDAVQEVITEIGSNRDAKLLAKLVLNDPDVISHPDDRFKVWPTMTDQAAFRAAMDNDADASAFAGTAIADAHLFFKEEARAWMLEEGDPEERGAALSTALHGLFQMVVIDLQPHDNAQVIFETLNARGTPLLAADLVKNHVMQVALSSGLDVEQLYRERWKAFDGPYWRHEVKQGRLVRPRVDMFFDFWLEMELGAEVPSHDVFPEFRRYLAQPGNDVSSVVERVNRGSSVFERLHTLRDESPDGVFLYRWDVLEAQVISPVLMWLFEQPESELPAAERHLALQALESFLVRRMVARRTAKNYNRLFLDLLEHLKSGEASTAGSRLRDFLAGQTADANEWPNDVEFATALIAEPLYARLKRSRLRMMLEALEDDLRVEKSEDLHVARNLTIEHLLPQAWNTTTWPLPGVEEPLAETQRRNSLVHSLGNLTLVTGKLNPELSNGPWEYKRPRLDEHGVLRLHHSATQSETWGEREILDRSCKLATRALSIWAHPDSPAVDMQLLTRAAFEQDTAQVSGGDESASDYIGLFELIREELLEPGERLECPIPSRGVTHEATLLANGSLVLSTGETFDSPSGAAVHLYGRAANGWNRWRVPRLGGMALAEIRAQFVSDNDDENGND